MALLFMFIFSEIALGQNKFFGTPNRGVEGARGNAQIEVLLGENKRANACTAAGLIFAPTHSAADANGCTSTTGQRDLIDGLTVGGNGQVSGSLTVSGELAVNGQVHLAGGVGIGSSPPATALDVAGAIKVGGGSEACDGSKEGSIRYNASSQQMEFCNGADWNKIGGNSIRIESGTSVIPNTCGGGSRVNFENAFFCSSGSPAKAITFATPFESTPHVIVSPNLSADSGLLPCTGGAMDQVGAFYDNVTLSGFRAFAFMSPFGGNCGSWANYRGPIRFSWIAIGGASEGHGGGNSSGGGAGGGLSGGGGGTPAPPTCTGTGKALQWDGREWSCNSSPPPPTCSGANNALQWDGLSYVCADLGGGGLGSTLDLVYGQHSSSQCESLGGSVLSSGAGKFCRFSRPSCPTGWAPYRNWSHTTSVSCTGAQSVPSHCGGSSSRRCTTGSHSWSDQAIEVCRYFSGGQAGDGQCEVSPSGFTCRATVTQIGCY